MWRRLALAGSVAVPALLFRVSGTALAPEVTVLVFGAAVVASAVLLSWAAEAAQVDISGSLAAAILALIAVLPEYAVDLYFSFTAGGDPAYTQFAAANMTGSNRLLIGIGWPLVAFVGVWAARRRGAGRPSARTPDDVAPVRQSHPPVKVRPGDGARAGRGRLPAVVLPARNRVELAFLAVASAYAFLIPLTRSIA